jgi:1,4-dihydroxy-6-naphthoate synthase
MVARRDGSAPAPRRQRHPPLTRAETLLTTTNALRDSIQHALDHREEALEYAMQFARDLDTTLANRFVGMYVNERTLNYGEDGKEAIRKLLALGYERGIIPMKTEVDFVG